ncbi:MAG: tyrosine-type recombinase/integrase [Leptolyngbyaceae cyanobacterium]
MSFAKGENPHHPQLGSKIKVEPIREKRAIGRIKKILADQPRNLCLFTLGINTAYRASDLLTIKVGQVRGIKPGDVLEVKQPKTARFRSVVINPVTATAIHGFLDSGHRPDDELLFIGKRGLLTVPSISRLVKTWCREVGLKGNYGSHTLRKTWGYWQRIERGTSIPLLMEAFGHATQQQTLSYLGIQADEIAQIYELEL